MEQLRSKFVTIQLGYVLGVSSLLTAIVYFFATNWEALSRAQKLVPVFMLILGFYGLSVWLSRLKGREFLSRLSLFASCTSFGIGIALIGQTYNSHADSYSLFAVWLMPTLLFAWLTRWQPFYILAYVLGHLAYMFYFFPKWYGNSNAEAIEIVILLVLAVANGGIYVLTERGRLYSPFLKWTAFQSAMGIMLWASNSIAYEHYGVWLNLPLIAVLAGVIRYVRQSKNKTYLLFAGLWVSVTITLKYVELAIRFYSEWFYFGGILFVILFIGANVKFVQYVRSWNPPDELNDDVRTEGDFMKWVARVIAVSVIVIGTLIGSLSIIGLATGILGFKDPQQVLIGFGLAAVISMIFAEPVNSLVRYTLVSCGLLLGAGTAAIMSYTIILLIFLALTVLAFIFIMGKVQRIGFFLAGEAIAAFALHNFLERSVPVFLVLTLILLFIFIGAQVFQRETVRNPLLYSSFPSFLFTFFILTFITESAWYYVSNGLFFLTVILALVISRQLQTAWIYGWGLTFWIAFLIYKYYDLAWKLLHKSISFAILGVLIMAVTVWYERRHRESANEHGGLSWNAGTHRLFIGLLVAMQIGAMTLLIGKSEWLLANGKLIKLELAPLDPRSIMQGDYVRLRYAVSNPKLPEEWNQGSFFHKKVAVVLAPNASTGIYEFRRFYSKGESLGAEEIRLNGAIDGFDSIEYGIETYFIPEGTGRDVERNARYAEVKVSAGGDAILVRLLEADKLVK